MSDSPSHSYILAAGELQEHFAHSPETLKTKVESCVWYSPFFSTLSVPSKEAIVALIKRLIEDLLADPRYAGGTVRSIQWACQPHTVLNQNIELGCFCVTFVRNPAIQ